MNREEKSLRGVRLFAALPEAVLASLEADCQWLTFESGESIINYMNKDDRVYFLTCGCAKVLIYSEAGKTVAFRRLTAGDFFGELAAIDGMPRTASVEAIDPCTVAILPADKFRSWVTEQPGVALKVMDHLVHIVRDLTARVYEFSILTVQNRIQAELVRRANADTATGRRKRISPAPRHADIASRISTHREAVSREVSRLTKIGILQRDGGDLVVNDIERLEELVRDATRE